MYLHIFVKLGHCYMRQNKYFHPYFRLNRVTQAHVGSDHLSPMRNLINTSLGVRFFKLVVFHHLKRSESFNLHPPKHPII